MLPIRNITFFLVFIVGGIILQIFLSKRESKWPGLVLPIISFIFSLIFILNIAGLESIIQVIALSIITLLLTNIPTVILLAIYFSCREKIRRTSEINKMNIQDL
ncbi:MAG: hypothetical protein CVV02_07660 [Firmicutes bacterium HGW-Firmicutes-7]|nr:MAG: hypothetical protein CVV02_07660 [Firmicutes bacterium HGW-Firmicutes-7]